MSQFACIFNTLLFSFSLFEGPVGMCNIQKPRAGHACKRLILLPTIVLDLSCSAHVVLLMPTVLYPVF